MSSYAAFTLVEARKGMWPPPTYEATYHDGVRQRMSFWSRAGEPIDIARGRRLAELVGEGRRVVAGVIFVGKERLFVDTFQPPKVSVREIQSSMFDDDDDDEPPPTGGGRRVRWIKRSDALIAHAMAHAAYESAFEHKPSDWRFLAKTWDLFTLVSEEVGVIHDSPEMKEAWVKALLKTVPPISDHLDTPAAIALAAYNDNQQEAA